GHVYADEEYHRRRAPEVHPAQEVAEWRVVRYELQAGVCVARGRNICRRQGYPRDHLHDKRSERSRPEHVPPVGPRRDGVLQYRPHKLTNPRAVVKPVPEAFEWVHISSIRWNVDTLER